MKSLKDYILENIDQVLIFSRYLDISEDDIKYSINFKCKLRSPTRTDPDPSLSFKYYGNKLICTDFGDVNLRGDVFEIVGNYLNLNCRNAKDFITICTHIINSTSSTSAIKVLDNTSLITDPTTISIETRNFHERDYRYFWQYNIDREIVSNNYFAVARYCINDVYSTYKFTADDPCYAYVNNPNSLKLYFPFRGKSGKRFISNNKIPIEVLNTLRVRDYTILIKAFKDKLLMDFVCSMLGITNVQFLPVASESTRLPANLIILLDKHTAKRIFTMFDIDKCGIESAEFYKTNYGISNIMIGQDYTTKDPTDLIKKIKLKLFLLMFKNIYECF